MPHIITHITIMKTTLDLADELLIEAKALAARRRTSLKALVEHALRREIEPTRSDSTPSVPESSVELSPFGLPRMRLPSGPPVTSEQIYQLMEEEEN